MRVVPNALAFVLGWYGLLDFCPAVGASLFLFHIQNLLICGILYFLYPCNFTDCHRKCHCHMTPE